MSRNTKLKSLFFALCISFTASQLLAQLPAQPSVEPASGDHGVYSTVDTTALPQPDVLRATGYDNFSTTADYILSGICWTGIYESAIPANPSDTDFIVNIFGDASGAPDVGNLVMSWSLDGGLAGASGPDVTVTSTGDVSPATAGTTGGGPGYDYDAAIGGTLPKGSYWISIVADQRFSNTIEVDPEWQWHTAAAGDGHYHFDAQLDPSGTVEPGFASPDNKDLAFTLKGTLVPEPTGAMLGLIGFLALGMVRRKRS